MASDMEQEGQLDSPDGFDPPWEYKGSTMTPKTTKKGNRRQSEVDWLDEVKSGALFPLHLPIEMPKRDFNVSFFICSHTTVVNYPPSFPGRVSHGSNHTCG